MNYEISISWTRVSYIYLFTCLCWSVYLCRPNGVVKNPFDYFAALAISLLWPIGFIIYGIEGVLVRRKINKVLDEIAEHAKNIKV